MEHQLLRTAKCRRLMERHLVKQQQYHVIMVMDWPVLAPSNVMHPVTGADLQNAYLKVTSFYINFRGNYREVHQYEHWNEYTFNIGQHSLSRVVFRFPSNKSLSMSEKKFKIMCSSLFEFSSNTQIHAFVFLIMCICCHNIFTIETFEFWVLFSFKTCNLITENKQTLSAKKLCAW